MRNIFIVLGFVAAILALVLSVTPLSQIAYLPAIAAIIFGFIAFYISKRKKSSKKSIQLIFLLTIISLVLTTYKVIFNTSEVGNLEEFELKKETSVEDSKEILEGLDLEEIDFEFDELPELEGLEDQ